MMTTALINAKNLESYCKALPIKVSKTAVNK